MPLASLPGPVVGQWHLGPVPVHGYALFVVLGVVIALWVAERRYRAIGGGRWLIVDLATIAVPAALIGARLYRVLTDYQRYFGPGRDWVDVVRIWHGGLGLPGATIGGLVAVLILGRRRGIGIGPVLCAAVPGLAFGQAVAVLGNWFSQSFYGPPSTMPWAVPIAPRYRVPGYQVFDTFQPLFLYESIWDMAIGFALIRLVRARRMTGAQTLAAGAGLFAVGRLVLASLLITGPQQQTAVVAEQVFGVLALIAAACYLYASRHRRGPEPLVDAPRRRAPAVVSRLSGPSVVAVAGLDQDPDGQDQAAASAGHGQVPAVTADASADTPTE